MLLTVLIKELSFRVSVNPDICIQPQYLAAPQVRPFRLAELPSLDDRVLEDILESRTTPQSLSEIMVINPKAVIDADSFTSFGLTRCGHQRKRREECDITLAQGRGPQARDGQYLILQERIDGKIRGWDKWIHGRPVGSGRTHYPKRLCRL